MDNITTGSFIKQLRKEKDMTQKQLADLLHITDRAASVPPISPFWSRWQKF